MVNLIQKVKKSLKRKETPDEIFTKMKASKTTVTEADLHEYYNKASLLAESFIQAGQTDALEKIMFLMGCVEKERKLLILGINQYIYRDDIEEFLERREIKESSIKLIELADYPRKIPKDIRKKIEASKDVFDKMYVLFTDYANTVTKNYQREERIKRRDRDPILFGTFQKISKDDLYGTVSSRMINDKFYVIGDWTDKYCDLTLDKLVSMTSPTIVNYSPKTLDELNEALDRLKKEEKS